MPASTGEGGGSSAGSSATTQAQPVVSTLASELKNTWLHLSTGTLNLTGVRAWRKDGSQHFWGSSETGTLALSTTSKPVLNIVTAAEQGVSGNGDDAGIGPIVVPYYNGIVYIRKVDYDVVNDTFTTPLRPYGYGDVITLGDVPVPVPVVRIPLWMYAFTPSSNGNVVVALIDKDRRTIAEASCAVTGGSSYTVHSMLGGSWVDGAIQACMTPDVPLKWNTGGAPAGTVSVAPVGASVIPAGKGFCAGLVEWPGACCEYNGDCLTRQQVAEASIGR